MRDILFMPNHLGNIYVSEIVSNISGEFIFKGHCYIDPEDFPIERILYDGKNVIWIKFLEKRVLEKDCDSGSFYDEDVGANICLFPTYTLCMPYKVLGVNLPKEKMDQIYDDIKADAELCEKRRNDRYEQIYRERLLRAAKAETGITESDASANVESVTGAEQVSDISGAEHQVSS